MSVRNSTSNLKPQSSCESVFSHESSKENILYIKQLEEENRYMKKERQKWLKLQEEFNTLQIKIKSMTENKPQERVYIQHIISQLETLQSTNQSLEQQLIEIKTEYSKYKQATSYELERLKIDNDCITRAYNELKENYSADIRNSHEKYNQLYSEKVISDTKYQAAISAKTIDTEFNIEILDTQIDTLGEKGIQSGHHNELENTRVEISQLIRNNENLQKYLVCDTCIYNNNWRSTTLRRTPSRRAHSKK